MHIADPITQPEFYASVAPKRAIAWVLDNILIALICVLILPFTAFTGILFFPFLMLVIGFAYRVMTLTGGSATLGMRVMSIEFRNEDGTRLDLPTGFWHTVGYSISWSVFPLQLVSVVLMLVSARGQGLTDHVLSTVVLNRRAR